MRRAYRTAGRVCGIGGKTQLWAKVNQIDEADLDVNNIYLTTEEGYLMVEEDNKSNIIIQED